MAGNEPPVIVETRSGPGTGDVRYKLRYQGGYECWVTEGPMRHDPEVQRAKNAKKTR